MGGQYFNIVILTNHNNNQQQQDDIIQISIDPYIYGEGYHLMQHAYLNTRMMGAIEFLISPEGKYHKSAVVWAGDCAERTINGENLFSLASENTKPVPPPYDTRCYRYIVNHTKKMYVDKYRKGGLNADLIECAMYGFGNNFIHPLPLLVVDNVSYGKGFYKGDDEKLCGEWFGDIISMELEPPSDYCQLYCNFNMNAFT
jgi:hypothetical protein